MEQITALTNIDYTNVFIAVFTILVGVKSIVSIFEWVINKFGLETKWMRNKREEHELLINTNKALIELQNRHKEDVKQSIIHDTRIREELSDFMNEIKNTVDKTQTDLKRFAENRIHDREQSFQIQKELTDAIKSVSNTENERKKQIEALMCGSKELLGAEIDKRYREYISLKGIPETEVDEFNDIFTAYKRLKGNHNRDTKYNYVKNHLQVIPVETKLVINENIE